MSKNKRDQTIDILFTRYTVPFYLIVILFILLTFFWDSEYISRIKQLTKQKDNFNIMTQFFIPGFAGIAGGYSTVVISSFNNKYIQHNNVFSKFMGIGFIAGVVAVNLLNPSGTVSQVMILGLLAGLSGFSYLERSALVQADAEKRALVDKDKDEFWETFKKFDENDIDSNFEEQNIKTLEEELYKELANLEKTKKESEDS